MRKILKTILALITGIAIFWMTAPDVVARLIHPMPSNSFDITITRNVQHIHFSHYATGTAWLIWIAVMLLGWWTKRWGKRQVQVGIPIGLLGALPVIPFLKMTGTSILDIIRGWNWISGLALIAALLVLTTKLIIWRAWYKLTIARPTKKTPAAAPGVEDPTGSLK